MGNKEEFSIDISDIIIHLKMTGVLRAVSRFGFSEQDVRNNPAVSIKIVQPLLIILQHIHLSETFGIVTHIQSG